MDLEKQKKFLINFLYFAVILGIAIVFCRMVIPAILPFFIAFIVALVIRPVMRFFSEKARIRKGVVGIVLVILFYGVVGFLIAILSIKAFSTSKAFVLALPTTYELKIKPFLASVFNAMEGFAQKLNPETAAAYDSALLSISAQLEASISNLTKSVFGFVGTFALGLPGGLLNTLIAIIATIFLAIDWEPISSFLLRQIPEKARHLIGDVKSQLGKTLGNYIRSYALIMLITFSELSVGFLIIGVDNPFGIAALIAVLDILPVLGSGGILIPWAIVSVITGEYMRALGLGIIYIVVLIVRNIIEPKIVGDRVGLHPIVTLMGMVVGTYLFGPIGLLGLPVTLALVESLNSEGIIHVYKRKAPEQEGPPRAEAQEAIAHKDESIFTDSEQEGH